MGVNEGERTEGNGGERVSKFGAERKNLRPWCHWKYKLPLVLLVLDVVLITSLASEYRVYLTLVHASQFVLDSQSTHVHSLTTAEELNQGGT